MSNFQFLLSDPGFASFADVAIAAEKILHIDPAASILNCRRAMEFAVKWMYSVDADLEMPYQDNLISLMSREEFRQIVGPDLWQRMDLIRKKGNTAAHDAQKISEAVAMLCLENLHIFLDFVAYCYADKYVETKFNPALVPKNGGISTPGITPAGKDSASVALQKLIEENKALKAQLTAHRLEQQQTYVPRPLDISEYETRKFYIDAMLEDAGWTEGKDWRNEVALPGVSDGFADYVLYDDACRPLAIIEARRTCADVSQGRQQAERYADILEKQYQRRPVIFLTNGFETHILDGRYPERKCASLYAKRDLEKMFRLLSMRTSLKNAVVKKHIADRYYQEDAIRAVCDAFDKGNHRNALLVMAAGSGKTRTVIALCDVLLQHGWVKNILFLADRNSLVTQAERSFTQLLPHLSCANLCEERANYTAQCVFSTYEIMMDRIDSIEDAEGKLFTCGYFDLVICDEAHRSICNKYQDILDYFDAPLVGLTANPGDEIDPHTYGVFAPETGVPTYAYELAQAVRDGYLVDFMAIETKLHFSDPGITYADLSETEREAYEKTFIDDGAELPEKVVSSALDAWIFNEETIRQALRILMTEGLKIDHGQKLGKTIIFAKNHAHAEKIAKVFHREYPQLSGFARVIDTRSDHPQDLIDQFSDPKKLPQIAISADMLDAGIDVPECLNLVFFKKVMSKAKFRQMIGRGSRLCPGLRDGEDKDKFYIFDFCGNFAFFRVHHSKSSFLSLQGAVFSLEGQIAFRLQEPPYQTPDLVAFRNSLVEDLVRKVRQLDKENFAVRQHLKFVELFSDPAHYNALSFESTLQLQNELAPLIIPDTEDVRAVRFDALMYGIALAYLMDKKYAKARKDLRKKVSDLAAAFHIPEIRAQRRLINKILHTDYLENAGILEFEHIRKHLRGLISHIPPEKMGYTTDFTDLLPMD